MGNGSSKNSRDLTRKIPPHGPWKTWPLAPFCRQGVRSGVALKFRNFSPSVRSAHPVRSLIYGLSLRPSLKGSLLAFSFFSDFSCIRNLRGFRVTFSAGWPCFPFFSRHTSQLRKSGEPGNIYSRNASLKKERKKRNRLL